MSKNEINDAMTISEAFKDVTQTFEMMSETIRSSAFFKLTVDVSGIIGALAGIIQLQKNIEGVVPDVTNVFNVLEDSSKRMSKLQFGLGGLAAVTAIVVPLIDYFVNMMSTNETLSAKMEEIWVKSCIYIITLMVV